MIQNYIHRPAFPGSEIGAGKHQIRFMGHDIQTANPDTVSRSAAAGKGMHSIHRKFMGMYFDGRLKCNGVGTGASFAVGCHHPYLTKFLCAADKSYYTLCCYTIVICDKYFKLVECIIDRDTNENRTQEMRKEFKNDVKKIQEEWKQLTEEELTKKCTEVLRDFEEGLKHDNLNSFGCFTGDI